MPSANERRKNEGKVRRKKKKYFSKKLARIKNLITFATPIERDQENKKRRSSITIEKISRMLLKIETFKDNTQVL